MEDSQEANRKFLEEAGCLDETMSSEEVRNMVKALNESRTMADEKLDEEKAAIINDSFEDRTNYDDETHIELLENMTFSDLPDPPDGAELLNLPPPKGSPERAFDLPIPQNPRFQGLSSEQKVALMIEHRKRVTGAIMYQCRKSWHYAPFSEAIHSSDKCLTSLRKRDSGKANGSSDASEASTSQDVYISRSGRQVKPRIYNINTIEDSDPEEDEDHQSTSAKSKKRGKMNTSLDFLDGLGGDNDDSNKITLNVPLSPTQSLPSSSYSPDKKINSPLRTTSPPLFKLRTFARGRRRPGGSGSSRSDAIFDKLKEDEPKRRAEEIKMEEFMKTLKQEDSSFAMEVCEVPEEDDVIVLGGGGGSLPQKAQGSEAPSSPLLLEPEVEIKRRVVPPLHKRKLLGSGENVVTRKRAPLQDDLDKIETVSSPPKRRALPKPAGSPWMAKALTVLQPAITVTKSKGKQQQESKVANTVDCPLCGKPFAPTEIETHAATCGEEDQAAGPALPNISRFSCDICDKVVLDPDDYEKHRKICSADLVDRM